MKILWAISAAESVPGDTRGGAAGSRSEGSEPYLLVDSARSQPVIARAA
jgi:hypothetical protein